MNPGVHCGRMEAHRGSVFFQRNRQGSPTDNSTRFEQRVMPTISIFYGIVIRMFFDDHGLPHFHAQYGEYKATVDIVSLSLAEGRLPRRALELVLDWAELHQD